MTLNILALAKQVEELIKNGGSGGTSDYEQLSKKPQINSHTLIGNKSAHDLGLATEEAVSGKSTVTANPEGTSSGNLSSIGIDGTKYNIPSGGGSDIPTPTSENIGELITFNGEDLEWADPDDLVLQVPYSESASDVGKVLTKYGNGSSQYGWINAQAAYTDYANSQSGLNATTVQAAIDELAQSGGGGENRVTLFDGYISKQSTGAGWGTVSTIYDLCNGNFDLTKPLVVEIGVLTTYAPDTRQRSVRWSAELNLEEIFITHYVETDSHERTQLYLDHTFRNGTDLITMNVTLNFDTIGTDAANDHYVGEFESFYWETKKYNTDGTFTSVDIATDDKVYFKVYAYGI